MEVEDCLGWEREGCGEHREVSLGIGRRDGVERSIALRWPFGPELVAVYWCRLPNVDSLDALVCPRTSLSTHGETLVPPILTIRSDVGLVVQRDLFLPRNIIRE